MIKQKLNIMAQNASAAQTCLTGIGTPKELLTSMSSFYPVREQDASEVQKFHLVNTHRDDAEG
jgi:hypothetical protein